MSAAALAGIIEGIQLAIKAAPTVIAIVKAGKDLITALFTAKLISLEQQNVIHAHLESYAALWAVGIPSHWTVEPDPAA